MGLNLPGTGVEETWLFHSGSRLDYPMGFKILRYRSVIGGEVFHEENQTLHVATGTCICDGFTTM